MLVLYILLTLIEYYQRIQRTFTTHKIVNKPKRNRHPLFKITNNALVDLPKTSTLPWL